MLPLRLLSLCILIPYFLFTYGFVGEIAEGHIDIAGVPQSTQLDLGHKDNGYFNDREMAGARWLDTVSSTEATVSCDPISVYLLNYWFQQRVNQFSFEQKVTDSAYVYLRTWNIERAQLHVIEEPQKVSKYFYIWEYPEFYNAIYGSAKIYDNGGAQVFATQKY